MKIGDKVYTLSDLYYGFKEMIVVELNGEYIKCSHPDYIQRFFTRNELVLSKSKKGKARKKKLKEHTKYYNKQHKLLNQLFKREEI